MFLAQSNEAASPSQDLSGMKTHLSLLVIGTLINTFQYYTIFLVNKSVRICTVKPMLNFIPHLFRPPYGGAAAASAGGANLQGVYG